MHFAIHPSEGWPGEATKTAQSPVLALMTDDLSAIVEKLKPHGIDVVASDHGFAHVIAFQDPDGNHP